MAQIRGKSIPLYFGAQPDLKTVAPNGEYHSSFMYGLNPAGGQSLEDDPILGGDRHNSRDATAPAPGLANSNASLTLPSCMNHMGYALQMMFGNPAWAAVGGGSRRIYESGADTLPARTIAYELADGDARRMIGFVGGAMTWTIGRNAGFGRITLEGAARKYAKVDDLDLGAVPDAFPLVRSPAYRGIFLVDGVASATLVSGTIKYDNQLDLVDLASDDEFVGDICPGDAKFTASITVRYQTPFFADKAADAFTEDGVFPVEFEWIAASGQRFLLKAPRMRVAPTSEPISGPGGIEVTYELMGEQGDAAMLQAQLFNSIPENGYF